MSVFVSTRNGKETADARKAMINGLSQDGGLYAPIAVPQVDLKSLIGLSYSETAKRIIRLWFDDLAFEDIAASCDEAYLNHFDHKSVAPVVKAGDTFIVELFHGETCAFKDVALSVLPRMLVRSMRSLKISEKTFVLTATSGDTGSAAMNGFKNVEGTGIMVFYPLGGVSPLQRRQMVCMNGTNLTACAVRGNFDDCQTAVKKAFLELPTIQGVRFSSANSINVGRLVPQIVYYFSTYLSLLHSKELRYGEPLNFVVPTGNFGDILAGYYAKRMGLPVGKLICASNANNVLTQFFNTGVYDRRRSFLRTWSPSMDILISSNLERLLYHVQNCNSTVVLSQMEKLKKEGFYQIDRNVLQRIREDFCAYCFDDDSTVQTIGQFYHETGYLADPHTAVALAAEKSYHRENPGEKCAVLSTASPFKFVSCIAKALKVDERQDAFEMAQMVSDITEIPVPKYLSDLKLKPELYTDVIEPDAIIDYVLANQARLL